jgi:YHS domain-containing protein/adenylate kinase family enzyme
MSGHPSSAVEDGVTSSSPHLEEIRAKLWCALRVTHEQRSGTVVDSDDTADKKRSQDGGQAGVGVSSDVHTSLTAEAAAPPLQLSRADMEHLISCVYCAVHVNATAGDSEAAAHSVMSQIDGATLAPHVAVEETLYTEADVTTFLNSVPSRWLPDLVAAQEDAATSLWEDFNLELIDCIVNDEAPHNLLQPAEVLTLQRTTAAVELGAPFTDYLTLSPTRTYPPVYDSIFAKLACLEDLSGAAGLSLSQFRVFFHWFYAVHFRNTNLPRSNAAADNVYRRYQDARGDMTVTQFQLACEEMCAVYAQRRDADAYLQQLVQRTENVMAKGTTSDAKEHQEHAGQSNSDPAAAGPVSFFLHPEKVTLPAWQRDLIDPTQLYLPDELRVAQQEAERHRHHSSPRILLIGPASIGKSAVGHQLAEALHCVHLDVLELAMAALQRGSRSSVRDVVKGCMRDQRPLPLEAQVTLLREAMMSERARYRGYVFSDTIAPTSAATLEKVDELFLRPLKVLDDARPDYVVELVCAVPDVYAEYASMRAGAVAAACDAAWATVSGDAEKQRRAEEKRQMKADCKNILAHLVELESTGPKTEASAEELKLARQQAAEAQEILDALNAEESEERSTETPTSSSAAGTATDDAVVEAGEDAPLVTKAARENEETQLRLSALIYKGRKAAGLMDCDTTTTVAAAGAKEGVAELLNAEDWTSCWRKSIEGARSIGRHLSVDPIASSDSASVIAYITRALGLHPCDLAEVIYAPGDEAAVGGAEEEGATYHGRPSSLAEDEERCRAVEEMVMEKGLQASPVWKRFCPVTAVLDGVLIEGAACYACAYRGCYYYFASKEKRDAFADNPTRYLRDTFPEQRAVLLLADDRIVDAIPEVLQQVADSLAAQCRLTRFSARTYAKLLEPRQELLQLRAATLDGRRKAEAATRRARHERQEQAAKTQSRKPKGKLEPTKPKTQRLSDSGGYNASLQSSHLQLHKGNPSGRRRVPRAMVVEGPQSIAGEKQALINAAKERRAEGVPVLVTALTAADLDVGLFQRLAEQQLVPEAVVALSFTDNNDAAAKDAAEDDGDRSEVDDEDKEKDTPADGAAPATASAFCRVLRLLEKGSKDEWRSAKADSSDGAAAAAAATSPYEVFRIPVGESAVVAEVVAEVMQQLNPLSIVASEDAVDEALGEEGEDGGENVDEEEEEAAGDEALLYPEGTARPPSLPRAPRDPLVKPMRRFLHQFGSRLDFCPVTLHDRGILVRGKQELCLRYVDGLYLFATEDARDAFARCPQRYVGELPPQDVPPRVWVVGVTQSGKKTMASGLQEAFRVPYFVYDRQFFEECVEAALTPGGGMVRGVYIPADTKEANPYLKRAFTLLESVHNKAKEEKKRMEEKAEAERLMEEHERRLEERETQEDASDEDDWTAEKEADLQEKLEFEPEDEEEKQVRLSEAYLRIASCVTRFRPFDKLGYVMICPPFSDGDLDVLFDEGGIPEVVVRLNVDEEVFSQRSALRAAARRAAAQRAKVLDMAEKERAAALYATQSSREAARLQRAREKAVAKWRRRHIGSDDVDVPSDPDDADDSAAKNTNDYDEELVSGGIVAKSTADDEAEAEADRQAQEDALEEFMTFVEERRIEVVKINAAAAKETVRRTVVHALGRHLAHRASLFYHPEVLRPADAAARLAAGQCDWSCFGEQDPVRLYAFRREGQRTVCRWKPSGLRVGPEYEEEVEAAVDGLARLPDSADGAEEELQRGEEPEELSEVASEEVEELRAAVQRRVDRARSEAARRVARVHHRLYSFENDATLARFMRNPWPFMQGPPPNPTLPHAPVVAMFEPETRYASEVSGAKERSLADSVAYNLQSKCMSTSSLLTWGAVHRHWRALRLDCMLAAQQSAVDVSLTQKLLTLYLSSAEAKMNGVVLHNLPVTAASSASLTRVKCTAPVVRVVSALPEEEDSDDSATVAEARRVAQAMLGYASVALPLPHPRTPLDSSNLITAVHGVETFRAEAQEALLRESRGFPVALRNSYVVFRHVQRHLSEFGVFCPYEWVENGDLVQCLPQDLVSTSAAPTAAAPVTELSLGAAYIGHYYFFSTPEYLERFLQNPTTVTDPATAKPLPKLLPSPVPAAAGVGLHENDLALEGCCPVLLYDTRDRRGMRGVRQPTAQKGSLDFVVDYDGKKYATLNAENQRRFLRRPWQYVAGAQLPAVLRRPLPKGSKPSAIADTEEYLQRQLYDPVAQALLAVGRERPIYPGLSPEESALKYVALYLKAHRDPATLSAFEAESYKASFELFHKRATLYRQVTQKEMRGGVSVGVVAATATTTGMPLSADDEETGEAFCSTYEAAHANPEQLGQLNRLPNPSEKTWN